jgi:hypothetical protein
MPRNTKNRLEQLALLTAVATAASMGPQTSIQPIPSTKINEETMPALKIKQQYPMNVKNFKEVGFKKNNNTKRKSFKQTSQKLEPHILNNNTSTTRRGRQNTRRKQRKQKPVGKKKLGIGRGNNTSKRRAASSAFQRKK